MVPPRFEYGDEVRVTRNVRNDGTFPGAEVGELLIRRGSTGFVRDVGTFLQDQVVYSVHFVDADRLVGCREQELQEATFSRRLVEEAIETGDWDGAMERHRQIVEDYNREDCESARRLRDWLEALRTQCGEAGQVLPRPEPGDGDASEEIGELDRQLGELRDALLEGLPLEEAERDERQQGRFLLAHMLEFHRRESPDIVKNLSCCLKPGGYLCLLDLDHNALNHYQMPVRMEEILFKAMEKLEKENNFDPYVGRKLYAYLYDLGFENIEMDLRAHHLIYGRTSEKDLFNWAKKSEAS